MGGGCGVRSGNKHKRNDMELTDEKRLLTKTVGVLQRVEIDLVFYCDARDEDPDTDRGVVEVRNMIKELKAHLALGVATCS